MTHFTRTALASAILAALGGATAAHAQFTVGFEDAAVPATGTLAAPSTADAAATFSAAYAGTDTVQGVTFSDNFTVFRDTYTNDVGGSDLYGSTRGALALTNIVNPPGAFATAPDTGPGDPGPDGLTFATPDVLTGLYAGSVDYGDGTPGAATLTVTAFGPGGDLAHDTIALDTTAFALSHLDTGNFAPFAGQITGYRVNRTLPNDAETQLGGGGNYALDDLSFAAPAPEPSQFAGLGIGLLGLAGLAFKARKARGVGPQQTAAHAGGRSALRRPGRYSGATLQPRNVFLGQFPILIVSRKENAMKTTLSPGLAAFGLGAVLLGALLSPTLLPRAHSAGGPVAVSVANPVTNPALTRNVDGAERQPFSANIYVTIKDGSQDGSANSNVSPGTQTFAVPAGKRLVVETVSDYQSYGPVGQSTQVFIDAANNGTYSAFAVPSVPASPADYAGVTQPMRFYADAGTEVLADAYRTGTSGDESITVVVSGYLVNVP